MRITYYAMVHVTLIEGTGSQAPCKRNLYVKHVLKIFFVPLIWGSESEHVRSVNGAENGTERAENRVELERSAKREAAEREWSGERAESAAHSSLRLPNISLTSYV